MKVSILMAVYNGERFLEDAIASVLYQTHQDIELVICNDGSTDSTSRILDRHRGNDSIKILSEDHFGKVHAFNKSFENCTGDAVCFFAYDDILPPDSIQERVSFMERTGAGAVYCNGFTCDPELKVISRLVESPKTFTWAGQKEDICRNNFLAGATLLIRRDIADRFFPIPQRLLLEDWWVVFNTLYYAGRIEYLDQDLFLYRLHERNDTGRPPARDFDIYIQNHWKKHIDYYDELRDQLLTFDIPNDDKRNLENIIRLNKQVVKNTLEGVYSFPTIPKIRALGIPKYFCSQATIPQKAHLFVPLFNFFQAGIRKMTFQKR